MEELKCEYCDSVFKYKSTLINHKKRAKFCLEIQKKKNVIVIEDLKTCQFCKTKYASNVFNRHLLTCKSKDKTELEIYKEKFKMLQDETNKIIIEKDLIIAELRGQIAAKDEFYKKEHECLMEIAKQPKTKVTNTTNNKILNLAPLDLSLNRIKNILDTEFDHNYGCSGQKGVAEFTKEKLLLDDNGNLNYVCTDFDRKVFKYKDSAGELRKDTKAKKLTSKLLEAGLLEKNQNTTKDWCVNEEGDIISEKHHFMATKVAEINNIENDNSVFVKELSAITVP